MNKPSEKQVKKFWGRVDRSDHNYDRCWEWTGRVDKDGYGQADYQRGWVRIHVASHRLAWELEFGWHPGKQLVCHHCDNPPCCNPYHMFLGSIADNNADCKRKGRSPAGEKNGKSKLTIEDVRTIRRMRDFGFSVAKTSRYYPIVGEQHVRRLFSGEGWADG